MCVSLCVCKLGTSVFLWVAVPMCVYTCLHPSLCFSLWVHIYDQVCKCMCECVLMWAYICWYKYTSVSVWVLHTCVNMCFCMCRYVNVSYACLYMCVHKVWMYVTWKESHGNVQRYVCQGICTQVCGNMSTCGNCAYLIVWGHGHICSVHIVYQSSAVEIHLRLPLAC